VGANRSKKVSRPNCCYTNGLATSTTPGYIQLNVLGVPEDCGILTPKELEITGTDAVKLVQKLVAHDYSSYEVSVFGHPWAKHCHLEKRSGLKHDSRSRWHFANEQQ
jgi:hypothetical protein